MAKHGKRYDDAKAQINPEGNYHPLEAFRLLVGQEVARFDTTVEAHFRLGVNVRHAEEQLRGTIALPHGTGRAVTVAVFAEGEKAREAEEAGAQVVGGEDLVKKVEEGFTDFDVAIATPDMMGAVGRLGRVLGPSGKMPNPKTGTVTFDVGKAVADVIGGKVEYRTDRSGIVHIGLGKKSFTAEQLTENYAAILDEILRAKPASTKGKYIKSISVAQTMGPGIDIDPQHTQNLLEEATASGGPTAEHPDRRSRGRPAGRLEPGGHPDPCEDGATERVRGHVPRATSPRPALARPAEEEVRN